MGKRRDELAVPAAADGAIMNIFISGGAGFIGSHMLRRLLTNENISRVVLFDNFSSGSRSYLDGSMADSRVQIVEADLKDLDTLKTAMEGCETIYHLAANPDIAKAVTQPDIDFWDGTYLTQNVLEAMRATGARSIIYTSGSGVYGENPTVAFREDHGPNVPISTYGASKLASEGLISAYCHMFGFFGSTFRLANVVGPRQTHGVGYDFIRRLSLDPTRLRILGDGTQKKSYVHVEDVLDAISVVTNKATARYDVFNVATDDYITVLEIARLAVEVCGVQGRKLEFEFTGGDRGWKGDVPIVRFDCSKIKGLGWRNRRSSKEAILDSMQAMRAEIESA